MTPFQLMDARSAAEAVHLLQTHGAGAQLLAGGGDLLGLLKEDAGPARPDILINLAAAPDLSGITADSDAWRIGAMTKLSVLARADGLPSILCDAIRHIASPQLRASTTLGGNLLQRPRCLYFRHPDIRCFKKGGRHCPAAGGPAEAYPGALFPGRCHAGHPSDLAPVLIALEAEAEIAGPHGLRRGPLADLFHGAGDNPCAETNLGTGELLAAILLPRRPAWLGYEKQAPRRANEFASATAAAVIRADAGHIAAARIVLGGIAPAPLVCDRAPDLLVGRKPHEIDAQDTAVRLLPFATVAAALRPRALMAQAAIAAALRRALEPAM